MLSKIHVLPEPQNVALLGNKVFADIIKDQDEITHDEHGA